MGSRLECRGAQMLCVYSGMVPELDVWLREQLGANGVLTAIPFAADEVLAADEAAQYFRDLGIAVKVLPAADYYEADRLRQAILASHAVYLIGGNTYEFLDYARSVDLFATLSEFEARGGVIVGESAGSIILSPDIATAGIPSSFPDENTIRLQRLEAMGRLPFHISPHFEPQAPWAQRDLQELQVLADESGYPVVVLEDGEGFIVSDQSISHFYGAHRMLVPGGVPPALAANAGKATTPVTRQAI